MRERGRVLLVLLLTLLAIAAAPAGAQVAGGQHQAAVLGGPAPDLPATHHDLRDQLTARHALSTPVPDSWWAVGSPAAGAWPPPGRSSVGVVAGTAVAVGVAATPSTRAPPVRVD